MTPEVIFASVGALLTAFGFQHLGPGIVAWLSGRQTQEKGKVEALVREAEAAEHRADGEAADRRALQEYASQIRAMLIGTGFDPKAIPATPTIGSWHVESTPKKEE